MTAPTLEGERAAPELLPCPFCGGKAELRKTPHMWMVECNNAECGSNPDALAVFKHDAIAAWNRRTAAPVAEDAALPPLDAELPPLPAQPEELRARWKCEDCNGNGHTGEMQDQGYWQPPEPIVCGTCDGNGWVKTDALLPEQATEYARQAIAPYAERIRQLEAAYDAATSLAADTINARNAEVAEQAERIRLLEQDNGLLSLIAYQFKVRLAGADAHIERLEAAGREGAKPAETRMDADSQPVVESAQSIDTPEFRALLSAFGHTWTEGDEKQAASRAALIAYIDGRTAGMAPDEAKHAESEAVSAMLWMYRRLPRCYGRPPNVEQPITALAKLAGVEMNFVTESFAERGAAPSHSPAEEDK